MAVGSKNTRQYQGIFQEVIPFKATVDVANLADGAGATESVTVAGAALGDFVRVAFEVDLADVIVTAYVQSADTVEIRVQNESGGSVNLASTTVRGLVEKTDGQIWQAL